MKIVLLLIPVFFLSFGCNTIKTEHTVHITMDVNVKLDRELDNFFGDIDSMSESIEDDILKTPASNSPAPKSE